MIDLTMEKITFFCFLTFFIGMLVQRISGFGLGIVAIMLLPPLIHSYTIPAALTNILSMVSAGYLTFKFRKEARFRLIVPVLCGSFFMTFMAIRFANGASLSLLKKLLGVTLAGLSIWFLFLAKKVHVRPTARNGLIAGLCGGTLNGLFSTGGPPVVLYFLGATENHAVYLATVQAYFMFNNTYATIVRFLNGQITQETLAGLLGGIPGMLLGLVVGNLLEPKIPEKAFLRIIYIVMLVSGIVMIV